jgi:hypothetical protein
MTKEDPLRFKRLSSREQSDCCSGLVCHDRSSDISHVSVPHLAKIAFCWGKLYQFADYEGDVVEKYGVGAACIWQVLIKVTGYVGPKSIGRAQLMFYTPIEVGT